MRPRGMFLEAADCACRDPYCFWETCSECGAVVPACSITYGDSVVMTAAGWIPTTFRACEVCFAR